MNSKRRITLDQVKASLENSYDFLCGILECENEALDNMPENLHGSLRCQNIEENIDLLDDAISSVDDAIGALKHIN